VPLSWRVLKLSVPEAFCKVVMLNVEVASLSSSLISGDDASDICNTELG